MCSNSGSLSDDPVSSFKWSIILDASNTKDDLNSDHSLLQEKQNTDSGSVCQESQTNSGLAHEKKSSKLIHSSKPSSTYTNSTTGSKSSYRFPQKKINLLPKPTQASLEFPSSPVAPRLLLSRGLPTNLFEDYSPNHQMYTQGPNVIANLDPNGLYLNQDVHPSKAYLSLQNFPLISQTMPLSSVRQYPDDLTLQSKLCATSLVQQLSNLSSSSTLSNTLLGPQFMPSINIPQHQLPLLSNNTPNKTSTQKPSSNLLNTDILYRPYTKIDRRSSSLLPKPHLPLLIRCFRKTVWEDQGVAVYEIAVNDQVICRRADNNKINGTKLLNLANVTRGTRDSILKKEPSREVVRSGIVSLKGVWLDFEASKKLAIKYNIFEAIKPLFSDQVEEELSKYPQLNSSSESDFHFGARTRSMTPLSSPRLSNSHPFSQSGPSGHKACTPSLDRKRTSYFGQTSIRDDVSEAVSRCRSSSIISDGTTPSFTTAVSPYAPIETPPIRKSGSSLSVESDTLSQESFKDPNSLRFMELLNQFNFKNSGFNDDVSILQTMMSTSMLPDWSSLNQFDMVNLISGSCNPSTLLINLSTELQSQKTEPSIPRSTESDIAVNLFDKAPVGIENTREFHSSSILWNP